MNFRSELVEALIAKGFDVSICVSKRERLNELSNLGCDFFYTQDHSKNWGLSSSFLNLLNSLRLVSKLKPHLVISFTPKTNIIFGLICKILNVPVIQTITGLGSGVLGHRVMRRLYILSYRCAIGQQSTLIFQNEDDKNFFQEEIVKDQLTSSRIIEGSGVNIKRFKPELLRVPCAKNLRFLFLGRLIKDKGIIEFLEACHMLKNEYPMPEGRSVEFLVAGKNDINNSRYVKSAFLDDKIKNQVISYLGEVRDVRSLLARCDCVVLPSYREGLSRALLEAASMERVLIATNVPGCKQIVLHGKTGILCQPKSAHSLYSAIKQCIESDPKTLINMGKQARHMVEQRFSLEIILPQFLELVSEKLEYEE